MPAVDVSKVPATSGKETAQSVAVLEDLIKNLNVSTSPEEVNSAAGNIAHLFSGPIPEQALPQAAADAFKKQEGGEDIYRVALAAHAFTRFRKKNFLNPKVHGPH